MKEYYLCKLHNEVFGGAETRINTECFLPVWEGVSYPCQNRNAAGVFPPCMGGCIAGRTYAAYAERVSSLYGRVYRSEDMLTPIGGSFLPVWEGVSLYFVSLPGV